MGLTGNNPPTPMAQHADLSIHAGSRDKRPRSKAVVAVKGLHVEGGDG